MLIGLFPELKAPGGVQRAGRHIAAVLACLAEQRGTTYRLLSLNDPVGEQQEHVGDVTFRFAGFQGSKYGFIRSANAAANGRPYLIFVAHPNLAPVGWLIRRRTAARMVVVGWGIDVWDRLPWFRRAALQAADAVLAISTYTAEQVIRKQNVTASKVRLLPLAIEPMFWNTALQESATKSPQGFPEGRVLLSVARLAASEGYKGVDTVIQALPRVAAKVPDVRYVIAGDGDDRPRLERLSREAGVADRVHFLGQISSLSAELMFCYSNCQVFLLPSKREGFGLVFLEAMAFGKPVVGGAHGGTLDIIQDGVTGFLVPHGDVGRLAEVLETLLRDDELRRQMGCRAQEHVRTSYLFEHFRARLTHILDEMCAS